MSQVPVHADNGRPLTDGERRRIANLQDSLPGLLITASDQLRAEKVREKVDAILRNEKPPRASVDFDLGSYFLGVIIGAATTLLIFLAAGRL